MSDPSDSQNRSLIIASWVLIGLVCLLSLIPFLGFASWLIVGPILFIALVMGIIVLARGGTLQGLLILLVSLIVAPVFVLVAPFVTSLLGLGGAVAAVAAPAAVSRPQSPSAPLPPAPKSSASAPPGVNPLVKVPAPLASDENYRKFRDLIQTQASQLATLKSQHNAAEGPRGLLTSSDTLDLAQREFVQKENYYREQVFQTIARHTGMTPEQIAEMFATMARRSQTGAANP
jgi:uncharacterized protein YdbL (DUF1318 family)